MQLWVEPFFLILINSIPLYYNLKELQSNLEWHLLALRDQLPDFLAKVMAFTGYLAGALSSP
jgi:hypothetical protein